MKKLQIIVSAYVSTMQTVEVADDFDVNDDNAMYDLAHSESVQKQLRENAEDCIKENAEVVSMVDVETKEVFYEQ